MKLKTNRRLSLLLPTNSQATRPFKMHRFALCAQSGVHEPSVNMNVCGGCIGTDLKLTQPPGRCFLCLRRQAKDVSRH